MDDTIRCPGCEASLTLPSVAPGQTVQCPRCKHVFEPAPPKTGRIQNPPARLSSAATAPIDDIDTDVDVAPLWKRAEPPRGTWTAYLAIGMIGLSIVTGVIDVWVRMEFVVLAREQRQLGVDLRRLEFQLAPVPVDPRVLDLQRRWDKWALFQGGAAGFHRLTYIPAFLFFLLWIAQAHGNLPRLRAYGLSYSRGWAVMCCIIPLVNFFAPFPVLQEIWRASHPHAIDDPSAWRSTPFASSMRWWWGFFIAAWLCAFSTLFTASHITEQPDEMVPRFLAWMACDACAVAAGVMIIYIIHTITRRQKERFESLQNT